MTDNPTTYAIGGSWGDRIGWYNTKEFNQTNSYFSVVGWKARIPRVHDYLEAKMTSGRTAQFEFIKVSPQDDPPDMFFGTVKFLGYVP